MRRLAPLLLVLACTPAQQLSLDEVVPAGALHQVQGKQIAGRYWAELDPNVGGFAMYKLSEKNTINRNEPAPLTYDFSGVGTLGTCTPGSTCVPPADSIRLYTDPSKVTAMLSDGSICRSNGGPCNGMGGRALYPDSMPCQHASTWCGPLQMVSRYAGALPDPIVQIANVSGQSNSILGCGDTSIGDYGLCANQSADKVDSIYSSLTSPPMSLPSGTHGCSYCYGNVVSADNAGFQGLVNVVMPNLDGSTADATMKAINTDTLALRLANDNAFSVVITIYYAVPVLDATSELTLYDSTTGLPATCATPDDTTTVISMFGGGFGPPAECFGSQPLAQCDPASLNLEPGYTFTFRPTSGPDVTPDIALWGDVEVDAMIPTGMTGTGWTGVVTTPLGTVASTTTFDICP